MMHHARIAQRAFNTPLMVEPSKALAFLSGLGPRIAGQDITFQSPVLAESDVVHAAQTAHASLIGGGIAEGQRNYDNARCWTRPAAALLIATLWLSACATASSDARALCPPVVPYSTTDQARVAAEIAVLPDGAVVVRMLSDYAVLRDQARACAEI
jgi:hypothetical protein